MSLARFTKNWAFISKSPKKFKPPYLLYLWDPLHLYQNKNNKRFLSMAMYDLQVYNMDIGEPECS